MWRNCTVWLAGIVAMSAAGCVMDGSGSAAIRIPWALAYIGDNVALSCADAGTPTVVLVAQNTRTGFKHEQTYQCNAGVGTTAKLPSGLYDVSLFLQDTGGRIVSIVDYQDLDVRRSGVTEPYDIAAFPIQAWDLSWGIQVERAGGRKVLGTCRDVGAAKVEFTAQLGGGAPELYLLDCEAYGATTKAIRIGNYQAQLRLLDTGGQALSETNVMAYPVRDTEPALLNVIFEVR